MSVFFKSSFFAIEFLFYNTTDIDETSKYMEQKLSNILTDSPW